MEFVYSRSCAVFAVWDSLGTGGVGTGGHHLAIAYFLSDHDHFFIGDAGSASGCWMDAVKSTELVLKSV